MAKNLYKTVKDCRSCAMDRSPMKDKGKVQLPSTAVSLALVAIDVLEPIEKLATGKPHVVIITELHSKVIRAIPTGKIESTHF